jgi:hypothetical protein
MPAKLFYLTMTRLVILFLCALMPSVVRAQDALTAHLSTFGTGCRAGTRLRRLSLARPDPHARPVQRCGLGCGGGRGVRASDTALQSSCA